MMLLGICRLLTLGLAFVAGSVDDAQAEELGMPTSSSELYDACPDEGSGQCHLSLRQLRGERLFASQDALQLKGTASAGDKAGASAAGARGAGAADVGAEAANDAAADAAGAAAANASDNITARVGVEQLPWWWWLVHPTPIPHRPSPHSPSTHRPSAVDPRRGYPPVVTFYAYRAKTGKNYEDTNVNMANLAGVMWYLHNEVVGHCPRKFGITRIVRYKITMRPTARLFGRQQQYYAHLCHFDSGACTGPGVSINDYATYGYVTGCDRPATRVAAYPQATWYSFPGPCPKAKFNRKSWQCKSSQPGGQCGAHQQWSSSCTWRKQYAGEVSLEELTGIRNFDSWCKRGGVEYNKGTDRGRHTSFWNGKRSRSSCTTRMHALQRLFQKKFPQWPAEMKAPMCQYGDPKR